MQRQNMTIVGRATLYFVVVTLDSLLKKISICFQSSSPKNGETGHHRAEPLTPSSPPLVEA